VNIFQYFFAFIRYFRNFRKFKRDSTVDGRFPVSWRNRKALLSEMTVAVDFDRHYVYHTGWAARVLSKTRPDFHVDISSNLYFSSIVSAFVQVHYYEYRPPELSFENLKVKSADILKMPFENDSVASLSCMHVVEHVGLGRYGDALDPQGDLKAVAELKRILTPRGHLLFVVPIGRPLLQFNAHRIYSYGQIMEYFSGLELKEFCLVPDKQKDGGLIANATKEMADDQRYGCGCFWFTKR
jgi:SAM-dependent methyltransferase